MNRILISLVTIFASISNGFTNCGDVKKLIIEYTKYDSSGYLFEKNEKILSLIEPTPKPIADFIQLKVKSLTKIGKCMIKEETALFEVKYQVIGEISREEFLQKNYKEKINRMMTSGQFKMEKTMAQVKLNEANPRINFTVPLEPYLAGHNLPT